MTTHRAINWSLALLIAAVLSTAHLLDGPADWQTERLAEQSLQDAIKTEAAAARFARAAATICGENAAWRLVDDGATVQCLTKRGKASGPVQRVSL